MLTAVMLGYNSEAWKGNLLRLGQWYWRMLFTILALGLLFAVSYTRIILGVDSVNGGIFGTLLGMWFAFSSHFIVRDPLIKLA